MFKTSRNSLISRKIWVAEKSLKFHTFHKLFSDFLPFILLFVDSNTRSLMIITNEASLYRPTEAFWILTLTLISRNFFWWILMATKSLSGTWNTDILDPYFSVNTTKTKRSVVQQNDIHFWALKSWNFCTFSRKTFFVFSAMATPMVRTSGHLFCNFFASKIL